MKIYVDADACPVKEIIIDEAGKQKLKVVMVKSYSHFSFDQSMDHVQTIYVDNQSDAADYQIMKLITAQDFLVTQDYGLAALALAKGCIVLHHQGFVYTQENIERLLAKRHTQGKLRRSGQKTKGPKPFTDEDRKRFRDLLRRYLDKHSMPDR
jgi:uncharacterized protein YaiI (UPF0178 family)